MSALSFPLVSPESHDGPLDECETRVAELKELVVHLSALGGDVPSAAEIVHEVAQPVTAAANYLAAAEHLLSGEDAGAKGRGLTAVRHAQQCLVRTADVMASMKEATDVKPFDPSLQDLGLIVADAMQMFEFDDTIRPSIEIAPGAAQVMADGGQLVQVVSNLVRNALEATEGQAVRRLRVVSRRLDRNRVEVCIEDNGPGIAEEMRGLLFSSFTSTKDDGAGVGLSICRAIIERHHGCIWADPLAEGTAFCFVVPSRAQAAESEAAGGQFRGSA